MDTLWPADPWNNEVSQDASWKALARKPEQLTHNSMESRLYVRYSKETIFLDFYCKLTRFRI
jgi:hypothetical protein